jgi:hypothetical protein
LYFSFTHISFYLLNISPLHFPTSHISPFTPSLTHKTHHSLFHYIS